MVLFLEFCFIYVIIFGFTISITKSNCVVRCDNPQITNRFIYMRDITILNHRHLRTLSRGSVLTNGQARIGYQQKDVVSGIQFLSLPFCGIEIIQDGVFVGLSGLYGLNLADNKLKHVSARSFIGLPSLTFLNLNGNKDIEIEFDTFWTTPHLQQLYLSNINLKSLETKVFFNIRNLTTLDIHGNGIKTIGDNFMSYLPSLRHLDIRDNVIHTISHQNVRTMNQLCSIKLDSNPWSCDCLMSPLLEISRRKFQFNLESTMCSSPQNLQHRTFGSLKNWELKCISSESGHDKVKNIAKTSLGLTWKDVRKTTISVLYREHMSTGLNPKITVNSKVTHGNIEKVNLDLTTISGRGIDNTIKPENTIDKTTPSFLNKRNIEKTDSNNNSNALQKAAPETIQKFRITNTDTMVTTTNNISNTLQKDILDTIQKLRITDASTMVATTNNNPNALQEAAPKTIQKLRTTDTGTMVTTANNDNKRNTPQYTTLKTVQKLHIVNHTSTAGKVTSEPTISSSKFISSNLITPMFKSGSGTIVTTLNNRLQNVKTTQQYGHVFEDTTINSSQFRQDDLVTHGSGTRNSLSNNVQTVSNKIENKQSNNTEIQDRSIPVSTEQAFTKRHTSTFLYNDVTSNNQATEHVPRKFIPSTENNINTKGYPKSKSSRNISVKAMFDDIPEDFSYKPQMHVFNLSNGNTYSLLVILLFCLLVRFVVN